MRFHFLLSALAIILLPLASFAQSDRHPSDTEIEKLIFVKFLSYPLPLLRGWLGWGENFITHFRSAIQRSVPA
jgi:hypothetical protein